MDRRERIVRNRETPVSVLREVRKLLVTEDWSPRQISGWLGRKIVEALNATVYFADSYVSWQNGAIENTNKLIRQNIPKGTDFRELTDEFIHSVQLKLNRRPREKFNFSTPKDQFFKFLL